MVSNVADRAVVKFQLNMPSEVRAQLDEYVKEMNATQFPAKLTMTDVINAAVAEYIRTRRQTEAA